MPFILYLTKARPPSPMWHCTHATCECGASCHAVNCGCIGSWHAWPQNDGDSIEWSAPSRDQHDHGIDGRQRDEHHGSAACRRRPEIDDEPLPRRGGVPHQPAVLEPHAERNEQQAEHEKRRQRDEDDERGVRVVEEAEEERDEQGDKAHRARRGQHDARQRDRMSG